MSIKNTCRFGRGALLSFFLLFSLGGVEASAFEADLEGLVKNYRSSLPTLKQGDGEPIEESIVSFMKALSGNFHEAGGELLEDKIKRLGREEKVLEFVLPGFPFKSMNPKKAVRPGELDLAEVLALETLEHLCAEIERVYEHGVRVTIIPDAVRITEFLGIEAERGYYQASLVALLPSEHLKVVALEDFKGMPTENMTLKDMAVHLSIIETPGVNTGPYMKFVRSELDCDFYQGFKQGLIKAEALEVVRGQKSYQKLFSNEEKAKEIENSGYDELAVYLQERSLPGTLLKAEKKSHKKVLASLGNVFLEKRNALLEAHVKECAQMNCEEACQISAYISEYFRGYEGQIRLSVNTHHQNISEKFSFPLVFGSRETPWNNSLLVTSSVDFKLVRPGECEFNFEVVEGQYQGMGISYLKEK